MPEPMVVWAFPISPSNTTLLAYCDTLDKAFQEAGQHRRDLCESGSLEEPWPETSIFKLTLEPLDRHLVLNLLNEREPDWSATIALQDTVGIVTDDGARLFGEAEH